MYILFFSILDSKLQESDNIGLGFISDILSYIVSGFIGIAVAIGYIGSVKNTKVSVGDAISQAMPKVINAAIFTFLSGVIMFLSFIALIVPFFFVFPRLTFGSYLIAEKNMNAIDALKQSWEMSKGHVGKIYAIAAGMILMGLIAITVVGLPIAIYFLFMYQAGFFVLYKYIQNQKSGTQNPAGSPAMPQSPANPNPVAPAPSQPVIPPTTPQTMVPSGPSPDAQSAPQAEAPAPPTENTTTTPPQA